MAKCKISECLNSGYLEGYCRFHFMLYGKKGSQASNNAQNSTKDEQDKQIPDSGKEEKIVLQKPSLAPRKSGRLSNNKKKNAGKKNKRPIKKVSKKQAKVQREISKINKEQRKENPVCQVASPVCIKNPTFSHHKQGRTGKNATDKKKIIQCCNPCNEYLESHPEFAKAHGLKISKHEPNYKREK
jgi:arylamine N-acetyltransferase